MTGCVQSYLKTTEDILLMIADRPDCVALTGFDSNQIRWFCRLGIARAMKYYQREALRKKNRSLKRLYQSGYNAGGIDKK